MGKLEGRVGIVTGAARGMGAAHARAMGREGADVALVYRHRDLPATQMKAGTEEAINKTIREIEAAGRRAMGVKCDISKASEVEAMVQTVLDRFGKVDILVNNAAVLNFAPIAEMTLDQWNVVVDVNLTGTFLCSRFVLPHMIKQNYGRIIHIGSLWTKTGEVGAAHYSATKAAVSMLAKIMAWELVDTNITVNCLAPMAVNTEMMQEACEAGAKATGKTPEEILAELRRIAHCKGEVTPDDMASVMVWLASEEGHKVSGQTIWV
jgi:NAD(P)-dependent dehydrogenase (short-subunit alcohol dehydrogenase family)